ncbi:hypothetical protein JTE90_012841 [Oedothorax gibbosus]|uniref:Uncharacterized protein n=1 Tax=Oedothorax gibbosus TaxID=931172 RepID=A0AAV6TDN2_9ARAC|nr:hypothetical protein JTE90_012841 [Oedothorax gibbosus]
MHLANTTFKPPMAQLLHSTTDLGDRSADGRMGLCTQTVGQSPGQGLARSVWQAHSKRSFIALSGWRFIPGSTALKRIRCWLSFCLPCI